MIQAHSALLIARTEQIAHVRSDTSKKIATQRRSRNAMAINQPTAPAWEKLKKAQLARETERQIVGIGWLLEPLR